MSNAAAFAGFWSRNFPELTCPPVPEQLSELGLTAQMAMQSDAPELYTAMFAGKSGYRLPADVSARLESGQLIPGDADALRAAGLEVLDDGLELGDLLGLRVLVRRVLDELDQRPLNSVVSDISPNITGKWDMDQAVAMTLVAQVFDFSLPLLCKGGSFVSKLFQGVGVEELIDVVKPFFSDVRRFSPHASRNSSSEVYLVCRNFMPWKFRKVSVLEGYETALNLKLGGDDIEEAPDIITSSFSVRKKKTE